MAIPAALGFRNILMGHRTIEVTLSRVSWITGIVVVLVFFSFIHFKQVHKLDIEQK